MRGNPVSNITECSRVTIITYIFCVCTDVVGRLRIISTFCQPLFYRLTVGGCMVVNAALETTATTQQVLPSSDAPLTLVHRTPI